MSIQVCCLLILLLNTPGEHSDSISFCYIISFILLFNSSIKSLSSYSLPLAALLNSCINSFIVLLSYYIFFKSIIFIVSLSSCQVWFTLEWKSAEWTQRWADLWNDLSFSLCAMLSVCYMVATSDSRKKSEMEVSADWYVTIEYQRSSSIRVCLHWLLD